MEMKAMAREKMHGPSPIVTRRAIVLGGLACAACGRADGSGNVAAQAVITPPLRAATTTPIGCCLQAKATQTPIIAKDIATQFSQISAEWEMKMNAVVQKNGTMRFNAIDQIMDFARENALAVHGHTLVWYRHEPEYFTRLAGQPVAFARAYTHYISTIVSRYRGKVRGWDVVNEPVLSDGSGLRTSVWSDNLGIIDHMVKAFELAAQADPKAVLFLNEYDLEKLPGKRTTLMRLVEMLLKRGVPIGGIGTQSHLRIDLPAGAARTAMNDLATLGLPIHVSEFDISFGMKKIDLRPLAEKRRLQLERTKELADAFFALPAKQRYAFTLWGIRDSDSYLRKPPFNLADDEPLAFDASGAAKPIAQQIYQSASHTTATEGVG
jgi:endo-1,4-beta-xylanase